MLNNRPLLVVATVPVLLLALGVPVAHGQSSREPAVKAVEARASLKDGNGAEALSAAREGLEYERDNIELLDLASKAALEVDEKDAAIWYAALALDAAGHAAEHEELVAQLGARVAALDPFESKDAKLVNDYVDSLLDIGKLCTKRKFSVNAVDLLNRCKGTQFEEPALAELEKLYKRKKAMEAILASGIDVPLKTKRKLSAKKIAKGDREHADWDNRWELKGKFYTVHTNMGYAMAEDMLNGMEQVNLAYRKVFRYKERGGGTRRCNLYVYKSREEFDQHEKDTDESGNEVPMSPGIKGFYMPGATTVTTYDPRTEGRSLSHLWSTLFHEASHQFTELVLPNDCPGWLNEGTASYFEGARLLANGTLETNLIPDSRLRNLKIILERGSPSLTEVITFFEDGSYDGDFYPVGWGLVYFMKNYEDEDSERIYEKVYEEFMAAYKGGGKHDVKARFVEYFVKKAKDPQVKTFEAFEDRFKAWVTNLHDVHFGPPERADDLIARARKQVANKQREAAIESYRWALRKREHDACALFEMAQVQEKLKIDDAALYNYRHAALAARSEQDLTAPLAGFDGKSAEEVVEECTVRIAELDEHISKGLAEANTTFAAAVAETAGEYAEAGFPLVALRLIDAASRSMGPDGKLRGLRQEIASEADVDTRRPRRLLVDDELEAWENNDEWAATEDGVRGASDGLSFLFHREVMPESFRLEAEIEAGDLTEGSYFGLVFGINGESDLELLAVSGTGAVLVMRFGEEPKVLERLVRVKPDTVTLALEIGPNEVEFFVNGESAKTLPYSSREVRGQIGLFTQECKPTFADLRVLH